MTNRRLSTLLLCAMLFVSSPPAVRSQTAAQNALASIKFDEFGDIEWSDLIARLDMFAVELQNNPTASGHIIYYRSRRDLPGLSSRYAGAARSYLVNTHGIDAARVIAVDGGIRESVCGEVWVVPAGAVPPKPTNRYSYSLVDTDSAYKFDSTSYPLPSDLYESGSFNVGINAEGFAAELKKRPDARGYIIFYSQYWIERIEESSFDSKGRERSRVYNQTHLDPPDIARRVLAAERRALVESYGISPSRVVTVNGGYRKGRNMELWIVPRGERPPVPTPNVYPPRRKARGQ